MPTNDAPTPPPRRRTLGRGPGAAQAARPDPPPAPAARPAAEHAGGVEPRTGSADAANHSEAGIAEAAVPPVEPPAEPQTAPSSAGGPAAGPARRAERAARPPEPPTGPPVGTHASDARTSEATTDQALPDTATPAGGAAVSRTGPHPTPSGGRPESGAAAEAAPAGAGGGAPDVESGTALSAEPCGLDAGTTDADVAPGGPGTASRASGAAAPAEPYTAPPAEPRDSDAEATTAQAQPGTASPAGGSTAEDVPAGGAAASVAEPGAAGRHTADSVVGARFVGRPEPDPAHARAEEGADGPVRPPAGAGGARSGGAVGEAVSGASVDSAEHPGDGASPGNAPDKGASRGGAPHDGASVSGGSAPAADRSDTSDGEGGEGGDSGDGNRFILRLDNFEGPFDLLLQLISKHKLDVTEVALSKVTDDFMAHIRAMGPDWDLDQTTEFLVVAATLLDLKAARLLPAAEVEDEADLALLEARDLLFARLLQYRAYKQIADIFNDRLVSEAARHPRTVGLEPHHAELLPDVVISIGAEGFAKLAVKAMQPRPKPQVYVEHIHAPLVSVREQAEVVVARLRELGEVSFRTLTEDAPDVLTVVARFLALLELYRERAVVLDQPEALGSLMVRWTGADGERPLVTDEFDQEAGPRQEPPEKRPEEKEKQEVRS